MNKMTKVSHRPTKSKVWLHSISTDGDFAIIIRNDEVKGHVFEKCPFSQLEVSALVKPTTRQQSTTPTPLKP